jgi:hypothetical protein
MRKVIFFAYYLTVLLYVHDNQIIIYQCFRVEKVVTPITLESVLETEPGPPLEETELMEDAGGLVCFSTYCNANMQVLVPF